MFLIIASKKFTYLLISLQNVVELDEHAGRGGDGRRQAFGWQSSLAHYLGKLPRDGFAIIHKEYTPSGQFLVAVLKAMSRLLCLSSISQASQVVYLVSKSVANASFATHIRGRILCNVALSQAVGISDIHQITWDILHKQLPAAEERRENIARHILDGTKHQ